MEELDSTLFHIPGLVDYRASFDGKLFLEFFGKLPSGEENPAAVKALYPWLEVCLTIASAEMTQRPAYLGKHHIIGK